MRKKMLNEREETVLILDPRNSTVDIKGIVGYRNDLVVRRFCSENDASEEEGQAIFLELKKFLTIAAIDREQTQRYSPSELQDKMWHEFIMYTQDYIYFCEKYLGRFIHHVPCENIGRITNGCKAKKRAFAVFGSIKGKYWPNKETTMRCCEYG